MQESAHLFPRVIAGADLGSSGNCPSKFRFLRKLLEESAHHISQIWRGNVLLLQRFMQGRYPLRQIAHKLSVKESRALEQSEDVHFQNDALAESGQGELSCLEQARRLRERGSCCTCCLQPRSACLQGKKALLHA